jgi:MFS family permease
MARLVEIFKIASQSSVLVVALGYFVDIFDLTLFNMVRRNSLMDLGFQGQELIDYGLWLLNLQMIGMLTGGILWGQLGDRKGRLKTLYASILLYSVANIANAFVWNLLGYSLLRFIAGVGLAGELGVGITLVSEVLPKEKRGLGTALVAAIGVLGAVFGGILVEILPWRWCYFIGGLLGLILLALRLKVSESELFMNLVTNHSSPLSPSQGSVGRQTLSHETAQASQEGQGFSQELVRGNFFYFFKRWSLFKRLLLVTLAGVPIWYVAGILMPYTPELAEKQGLSFPVLASRSIAISYLGLAAGDFLAGLISQTWRSRKKTVLLFQGLGAILVFSFILLSPYLTEFVFYLFCFLIGVAAGFWALFVTVAAESFGTNLRATAATSIPNFVRASVTPMSLGLKWFLSLNLSFVQSQIVVAFCAFSLAILATALWEETFHKDLQFFD